MRYGKQNRAFPTMAVMMTVCTLNLDHLTCFTPPQSEHRVAKCAITYVYLVLLHGQELLFQSFSKVSMGVNYHRGVVYPGTMGPWFSEGYQDAAACIVRAH